MRPVPRTAATLAVALTAGALAVVPLSPAYSQAATAEVQILGINDFHGRLLPPTAARPATDTAPASPSRGGAAFVAGAVESYRAQNPDTIFVSAGDSIGASPFVSAVQQDEPTIEALNAMGLAASAVGNHEFDRGYADLAGRVVDLADFPILGANVEGEQPEMAPSHVVETASGLSVGFVGVVTEQTASLVSPDGIRGITFSDPLAAANLAADALSDGSAANGEADLVVLLAHEGASATATTATECATLAAADDAFGEIVRGVSDDVVAVLGGHTHVKVDCDVPLAGRSVPLQVLEGAEYGLAMDVLTLTVDTATGALTAAEGEVVDITSDAFDADAEVQAIVDAAEAEADVVGRQPVGRITRDIRRASTATGDEDRGAESLLGNLIADVQLDATRAPGLGGAQIAFMNPGGMRADLEFASSEAGEGDGVVTYAEAAEVQPFANGVITMTLTGDQVKAVLEEQFQPDGASRPFLALGASEGFRYAIDAAQPRGERISAITLNGAPIDTDAPYRVTVNSFLASGGDNFGTLADGTERLDGGFNDLNVLVEYFAENSPVTPSLADRAVVAGTEPALVLERLAGADRYGTAAEVALDTFGAAPEVLLGNGTASSDALAGNYLAGVRTAPVLLTARDTLPAATLNALRRLGTAKVTILGGEAVVGAGVVTALRAEGLTVERVQGADRYATAAAVAVAAPATEVGDVEGKGRTAVLSNGLRPVDALVAGSPAYAAGLPVLLTEGDALSDAAAGALDTLDIEHVLVVGGATVVSEAVLVELRALGLEVQRLSGADRRLTAVAVADYARTNLAFVDTQVVLARGDDSADALAGGPRAGRDRTPILLTASRTVLGAANVSYLAEGCDTLFDGRVLGGLTAVSDEVVAAAATASVCAS